MACRRIVKLRRGLLLWPLVGPTRNGPARIGLVAGAPGHRRAARWTDRCRRDRSRWATGARPPPAFRPSHPEGCRCFPAEQVAKYVVQHPADVRLARGRCRTKVPPPARRVGIDPDLVAGLLAQIRSRERPRDNGTRRSSANWAAVVLARAGRRGRLAQLAADAPG